MSGDGTQRITVFYDPCCRCIGGYSVNITTIIETAGVRCKPPVAAEPSFRKSSWSFLLQNEHTQWSFLGVWRTMLSCCSRIHATYQPVALFFPFQSSYILIMAVYKIALLNTTLSGISFIYFVGAYHSPPIKTGSTLVNFPSSPR